MVKAVQEIKALFKTKIINWKRNIVWSIIEILSPIILIMLIALLQVANPFKTFAHQKYDDSLETSKIINFDSELYNKDSPFSRCIRKNHQLEYISFSNLNGFDDYIYSKIHKFDLKRSKEHFSSEKELNDYIESESYEKHTKLCFALIFNKINTTSFELRIKYNSSDPYPIKNQRNGHPIEIFSTTLFKPTDKFIVNPYSFSSDFYDWGFIYLQNIVGNYLLSSYYNKTEGEISLKTFDFYFNEYETQDFLTIAEGVLVIFTLVIFIIPFCRILSMIVWEKETKIRQLMMIMGCSAFSYWVAWIIYLFIISSIITFIFVILTTQIGLFRFSNFGLVLMIFWLYSICNVQFCIMLSIMFNRSKTAVVVGVSILVLTYFVSFSLDDSLQPSSFKMGFSIFPSTAISLVIRTVIKLEKGRIGLQTHNLDFMHLNYSAKMYFTMMGVDIIILTFLAWYLDKVLVSGLGQPLPFYFILSKSYWFPNKNPKIMSKVMSSPGLNEKLEEIDPALEIQVETGEALVIRNLCKVYGDKEVVNNFSLDIYSGHITAVLGHNGAGKTTIMSMITGLTLPTSGIVMIENQSIFKLRENDQRLIGLCPQQNLIFPYMTPVETLRLFCVFKGMTDQVEYDFEINSIINDLEMQAYRDKPAEYLSGGQKRTLCLAISLVAQSKIILLDEPTAGMDSMARRHMWEVLKKYKNNRIIILTTHYMEEADILSDRIAIINDGKLVCCGSPLFLKSTYHVGYNLTCEKVRESESSNDNIHAFVSNYVTNYKIIVDNKREVRYRLPLSDVGAYCQLFNEMDFSLPYLEVKSYYVVAGSLEEVFLKIIKSRFQKNNKEKSTLDYMIKEEYLHKGSAFPMKDSNIYMTQIKAMMIKRFYCSLRDLKGIFCEILVPCLLILMGLIQLIVPFPISEYKELKLDVLDYGNHQNIYINQEVPFIKDHFERMNLNYQVLDTQSLKDFSDLAFDLKKRFNSSRGSYFIDYLNTSSLNLSVTILSNQTSFQSSVIFLSELQNSLFSSLDPQFKLETYNSPFPLTPKEKLLDNKDDYLLPTIAFTVAFSFIPSVIIQFIVKEKENNTKIQHFNSGMPLIIYWGCNFTWDIIKFMIPGFTSIILIIAFQVPMLTEDSESIQALIALILLYGPSVISFTYCTSFIFKTHSVAQVMTLLFNIILGGFFPAGIFLMFNIQSIQKAGVVLSWVLRVFPSFGLGLGFLQIRLQDSYHKLIGKDEKVKVMSLDGAGGTIIMLMIDLVIYFILLFIFEYLVTNHKCKKKKPKHNENIDRKELDENVDEDVKRETDLSMSVNPFTSQINVRNMMKIYEYKGSPMNAVNSCSFTIEDQECFAMLGTNGAGKSTIFKILTGEIPATSGEAYICGYQISKDLNHIRKRIGYCPQFEFTSDHLSVYENLKFYARIKGVPPNCIEDEIMYLIKSVGLLEYMGTLAINLSGGNKRKLTLAISLLNNPQVLFLDEPSAGMDPLSREKMLKLLTKAKKNKSAVILTTHLVEEAEALCDRLAIMVDGVFKCIGTPVHIRNKFGNYIQIDFKLRPHSQQELVACQRELSIVSPDKEFMAVTEHDFNKYNLDTKFIVTQRDKSKSFDKKEFELEWEKVTDIKETSIVALLTESFGMVEVIEKYYLMIKVKLQRRRVKHIGRLFELIESNKERIGIETYSITQASLEQIFNFFAKSKVEIVRKF